MPHKGVFHSGLHPRILDPELFEAVQAKLLETAGPKRRKAAGLEPIAPAAPLTGLVTDAEGLKMSPVAARGRARQLYRYYVTAPLLKGARDVEGQRVPAPALETLVLESCRLVGLRPKDEDPWAELRAAIINVQVSLHQVTITYRSNQLPPEGEIVTPSSMRLTYNGLQAVLTIPAKLARQGETLVLADPQGRPAICKVERDATLVRALARAEAWRRLLTAGDAHTIASLAASQKVASVYLRRVLRLSFLAPNLKQGILKGNQPIGLTMERFMRNDLPLDWEAQRRLFSQC